MEESSENTQTTSPQGKSRRRGVIIVVGIAVVFVGGLLGLLLAKPPQKSLCDEQAPALSMPLFSDYKGGWKSDTLNLADLRGKGVVLNFWASWCQPCEQEAKDLETAWQQYKDKGIVFVGVDYLDQEPSALRYLQKYNITYPTGTDLAGAASKRYTIRGVPETFFIDPQGKIVGCRQVGPIDQAGLAERIAQILPK